jgi:type I site-specific restriction endonuclease
VLFLSLTTGSGKTFIAVQLLKKIADAGQLKRAFFVCDRDELRAQGLGAFQNVFGADAAEVFKKADGANNAKNARIHVATYQTLNVDTDEAGAKLTADNLKYFGEPVYEYEMSQGIEDSYLAACEIHCFDLFHDSKKINEREIGIARGDLSDKYITDAVTGEVLGQDDARAKYDVPDIEGRFSCPSGSPP